MSRDPVDRSRPDVPSVGRDIDEARRQAISDIGHRTRTPLALLLGNLEVLVDADEWPEETRRRLGQLAAHAEGIRQAFEAIMELALWSPELEEGQVDLGDILSQVASDLEPVALEAGHTVEVSVCSAIIERADEAKLRWALETLVRSCGATCAPGGVVEVKCLPEGAEVAAIEMLVHAAPGETPLVSTAEQPESVLAQEIVLAHGATIHQAGDGGPGMRILIDAVVLQSAPPRTRSVGKQTTGNRPLGTEDAGSPVVGAPGTPLILVVEDDDELSRFLERILATDYRVVRAPTAEAGLELVDQMLPDLVICDIMLPGASGEQLVHALATSASQSSTSILVVTGRTDHDLRVRLLRDGADDYVMKPFIVDELKARIANLVSARVSLDELRTRAERASATAEQLQHALDSRIVIEQAKGIIAASMNVSMEEAFDKMRGFARSNNRRLGEIASAIVERGVGRGELGL